MRTLERECGVVDTKGHWENVYAGKPATQVSWYQPEPALSLRLIHEAGVDKDSPLVDIGGGASTLVDALCEQGYESVSVLDVSASALAQARARLGERAGRVEWFEADITAFDPPHSFQLWHDRAVFHFLTDKADRASYVQTLKKCLLAGGQVTIMTFAIGGPKKCSGLDIVQYDAEKMCLELGPEFDLLDTGHDVHITPAGGEQKFAWFRLLFNPAGVSS
ncbi:MAG: class I SAM-dependent methyltransferase [Xanthomonadales bacterium]|nr:class I SAM-dependent methyltransferase [Xanthomonadales bacterium]